MTDAMVVQPVQQRAPTALSPTRSRGAPVVVAAADAEMADAMPALRPGAPSRRGYARGRLPDLRAEGDREMALSNLMNDIYASSSSRPVLGRRACYRRILALWSLQPTPLTVRSILCLGAGLKAGGYRSAGSVLSQYHVDSVRAGARVDRAIERAFADAARSCRRGLGPPLRALALDVSAFTRLPGEHEPFVDGGPLGPRNLAVVGSWWLLRELEAAGARARHVTIELGTPVVATFLLPTSKTDPEAKGVARAHPCVCGGGPYRVDCPAHAAWDQLIMLRRRFPHRHVDGRPHVDLPLFPDVFGKVATKKHFAQTIAECAVRSEQPTQNVDGTLKVTGHSLRASGAQMLAHLGFGLLDVQLIGRWGSDALLTYVRGAAVGKTAARARAPQLAGSVRELASAAAAAGVPRGTAPDFEEQARRWFTEWLPTATAQLRPTLVQEVVEHLKRTQRTSSDRSTSSSRSSSSAGSSSSCSDAGAAAARPAAAPEETTASAAQPPEPLDRGVIVQSSVGPVSFCTVGNQKRRKNHLVVVGPPAPPEQWVTHCSWKFGQSRSATEPKLEFTRCVRCSRAGGPNWGGS